MPRPPVTLPDLHVDVVSENGRWSIQLPGLPIAGEGDTIADVIEDTIAALQEYAQDWIDNLHTAPSQEGNSELVRFVTQSTDEQLTGWLIGFVYGSGVVRWGNLPGTGQRQPRSSS
jgi:hypothetical protein